MSRFFDDLEAQLHAAARREVGSDAAAEPAARGGRFDWLWSGLRAAPVALAVLLTLAVVGGALVLLHGSGGGTGSGPAGGGPSGPSGGVSSVITPRVREEMRYITKAGQQVMSRPGCQGGNGPASPRVLHRRPGRALLSALGVLRRPAGPRDRLGKLTDIGGVDLYAGYTRFGRNVGGHQLYLVAGRSNPAEVQPPARCFAAEKAALVALLPSIPVALRAPTQHLQAQLLAYARSLLRPQDVVCLDDRMGGGVSTSCGYTTAQIAGGEGGSYITEGPGPAEGVDIAVVPDGVATVLVRWAASRGRPATSGTGDVVNNLAAVRIPGYRSGGNQPPLLASVVIWRSATGRVIRTWRAPANGSAGDCRKDPIPCIAVMSAGAGSSSSSSATATASSTTSRP